MKLALKPLTATVLVATALHAGAAFTQTTHTPASPKAGIAPPVSTPAAAGKADPLAGGAEIFENLTESAPTLNAATFKKSLSDFETLYPDISRRLSPDRKQHLDRLVTDVRSAWQKGDRASMAIQSIEAYRVLQEAIDHGAQPVPVEVPLLDYAGFKLDALLLSTQVDWKQVASTAQEASTWWTAIGPKVTDMALRNAMDHTIDGIKDAAARKDRKFLSFAAKMDLILVDGLEKFFTSHTPPR